MAVPPNNPTFGAPVTYGVGASTGQIVAADINGDGHLDLVVRDGATNGGIDVLTGDGHGNFSGPVSVASIPVAVSMTVADMNGDGRPDIVVGGVNSLTILLNSGSLGFTRSDVPLPGIAESIAVADFNGDQLPDLAVANAGSPIAGGAVEAFAGIDVLLSLGSLGFAAPSTLVPGSSVSSVAAGDLNGDRFADIMYVVPGQQGPSFVLGTNTGTFGKRTGTTDTLPLSVVLDDFNGDGKLDFLAPSITGLATGQNAPSGTLTGFRLAGYLPRNVVQDATSGDFNGDGFKDLVVATSGTFNAATSSYGPASVLVLSASTPSSGSLFFLGGTATLSAGSNPMSVAVGDFNEDGRPDIAATGYGTLGGDGAVRSTTGTGYVDVFLNQTVACFAAGTTILTDRGERPVERLAIGARVVTVHGQRLAAIRWLGYRTVRTADHPNPDAVTPVRISAHTFGPGMPHRDLLLSPEHAVFIDGALVPVRCLVNATTIARQHVRQVSYWHVELDDHDAVLAEGLPVESWRDIGNRHMFANGGPAVALHPCFGRPERDRATFAPIIETGSRLAALRGRLSDGTPPQPATTIRPPQLRINTSSAADGVSTAEKMSGRS